MQILTRIWAGGARAYRYALGIAILATLLLVWINGAVGMIGSEDNPANILYAGVIVVGIVGALRVRMEARGMKQAMLAVAVAQVLVPVVAFVIWRPDFGPGVVAVFVLNAVFAGLWVVSALLFGRAGIIPKS